MTPLRPAPFEAGARWGAAIPRSTLCEWIRIAADWLEPIYKTMLRRLLEGDYVQADETPIKCQDPDDPKLGIFQGYLWVVSRPGGDVCFDWRTSRQHAETTTLLKEFKGVLQADGYRAYDAHAADRPAVVRVGCWAHARRKWMEAQAEDPREVKVLLGFIAWMYHREALWDEADANAKCDRDPAARARLRQTHFARGLAWLHLRVQRLRERMRPKSGLGLAAGYLLSQWEGLRAHLDHGQTRLDNNLVENAIRPTARQEKLAVYRPGRGGPAHGDPLLDHRLLPAPRKRSASLHPRSAHASSRNEQPRRSRRAHASALVADWPDDGDSRRLTYDTVAVIVVTKLVTTTTPSAS